jgi:protein N-lysine methyltransferase METTL21D
MADVSYNTSSFPSLARTLSRLVTLGSKPPVILFGYKERDPAERTWWDIAAQAGIEFDKIGQRVGTGGAPVEIWVGRYVAHL